MIASGLIGPIYKLTKKENKMKKYRVYQTISIFVEANNEAEAKEKALTDDNLNGWNKWDIEECDSIIDFYPPL